LKSGCLGARGWIARAWLGAGCAGTATPGSRGCVLLQPRHVACRPCMFSTQHAAPWRASAESATGHHTVPAPSSNVAPCKTQACTDTPEFLSLEPVSQQRWLAASCHSRFGHIPRPAAACAGPPEGRPAHVAPPRHPGSNEVVALTLSPESGLFAEPARPGSRAASPVRARTRAAGRRWPPPHPGHPRRARRPRRSAPRPGRPAGQARRRAPRAGAQSSSWESRSSSSAPPGAPPLLA